MFASPAESVCLSVCQREMVFKADFYRTVKCGLCFLVFEQTQVSCGTEDTQGTCQFKNRQPQNILIQISFTQMF